MVRGIIVSAALLGAAGAAQPTKIVHDNKALQFSYEWPAEAAAVAALDTRFRADVQNAFAEARANAAEDQKLAREQKRNFNPEFYSMAWTLGGQSARLLSLQSELSSFTGGAHPNTSYGALIWERKLNRQVSMDALLAGRGNFAAIARVPYCKALDAERKKRRQGETLDLPEFNACPKFSDLAIAPVDQDHDGRFDHISFVASPYVAAPYVEGKYAIVLPVTAGLMGALRPEYRNSFEAQRQ
jgi:hypothetical protein